MKMVIYKENGKYKCTTLMNFFGIFRDNRLITDCSAFNNPTEIIEYYCKYTGSKEEDFNIIE